MSFRDIVFGLSQQFHPARQFRKDPVELGKLFGVLEHEQLESVVIHLLVHGLLDEQLLMPRLHGVNARKLGRVVRARKVAFTNKVLLKKTKEIEKSTESISSPCSKQC